MKINLKQILYCAIALGSLSAGGFLCSGSNKDADVSRRGIERKLEIASYNNSRFSKMLMEREEKSRKEKKHISRDIVVVEKNHSVYNDFRGKIKYFNLPKEDRKNLKDLHNFLVLEGYAGKRGSFITLRGACLESNLKKNLTQRNLDLSYWHPSEIPEDFSGYAINYSPDDAHTITFYFDFAENERDLDTTKISFYSHIPRDYVKISEGSVSKYLSDMLTKFRQALFDNSAYSEKLDTKYLDIFCPEF